MQITLKLAAMYNILWGAWVVLFPSHFFHLVHMEPINHPVVWQGIGMVIGVWGVGYWWASYDPLRHWPIVAIGFMGKILGPLGFIFQYLQGNISPGFGYTLITNDLIWWVPFALILRRVHLETHWKLA
ncbi:MAG: alkyl hydroperoxide reductase [Bacteroidota bacterium]